MEEAAIAVLRRLRAAGIRAEMAYRGNLKRRRMERANRIGARAAVILGEDEIAREVAQVKDLASGAQTEVPIAELVGRLSMSFSHQLDRIACRASAELKAQLAAGHAGEGLRASAARELAELDPVVARIEALRAAEHARDEAEALLARPRDGASSPKASCTS